QEQRDPPGAAAHPFPSSGRSTSLAKPFVRVERFHSGRTVWPQRAANSGETTTGGDMGLVVSLIVIAAGAILVWGVNADSTDFNVDAVGVILMIVGLVGFVLSLLPWSSWWGGGGLVRRRAYVDRAAVPPADPYASGGRRVTRVEEEEAAPPPP